MQVTTILVVLLVLVLRDVVVGFRMPSSSRLVLQRSLTSKHSRLLTSMHSNLVPHDTNSVSHTNSLRNDEIRTKSSKRMDWLWVGALAALSLSTVVSLKTILDQRRKSKGLKQRLGGSSICIYCSGSGKIVCGGCLGLRRGPDDAPCSTCAGTGTVRCANCQGTGVVEREYY
jgi:hypothetical protein